MSQEAQPYSHQPITGRTDEDHFSCGCVCCPQDLAQYHKALDRALMQYHSMKVGFVNDAVHLQLIRRVLSVAGAGCVVRWRRSTRSSASCGPAPTAATTSRTSPSSRARTRLEGEGERPSPTTTGR